VGPARAPHDWIVAGGVHLLRDGQAIRPVDRDNRPLALQVGQ
jgi:multidrug efflux system membrane fusion protein